MESKILSKSKNNFLNREEIILEIKDKFSPSDDAVKEALGKPKELIVVKNIDSSFGHQTFKADVVVYDSIESKDRTEVIPRKVRKKAAEDAKAKAAEEKTKKEAEAAAKKAEAPSA